MILAFWCVLIAALLPILCSYVAKFGGGPSTAAVAPARFDNRRPRAWLAAQTGLRARADAAQHNGFEVFPVFAAGVVIAVLQQVAVSTIDACAVVFVVARIAYIACYLGDRPSLRSAAFAVGFMACVALFLVAATGTVR